MKLRNKLIALLIILSALMISVCIGVSADADEESLSTVSEAVTDTDLPTEESSGDMINETVPNFFDELFDSFMEHSEKILGALTLIGSLILAFAYKRGFLPLVKSSLSALIDTVSKIKDKTQENDLIYKEFSSALTERLNIAETSLEKLTEHIDGLTASLGSAEEVMTENEKLKIIMNTQVDMLYDVFMCSSLPEFQKERIGERIKKMKEALGSDETE